MKHEENTNFEQNSDITVQWTRLIPDVKLCVCVVPTVRNEMEIPEDVWEVTEVGTRLEVILDDIVMGDRLDVCDAIVGDILEVNSLEVEVWKILDETEGM